MSDASAGRDGIAHRFIRSNLGAASILALFYAGGAASSGAVAGVLIALGLAFLAARFYSVEAAQ